MAWLWEALYLPLLATSSWIILRKWLLTQQNTGRLWLRYVGNTFVVWPHGPEQLQFPQPSIQLAGEMESDGAISFLDVLVVRKETTLTATKFTENPSTLADISTSNLTIHHM
jgi:hypothetical protein